MSFEDLPVGEFHEAIADGSPTPGGGAAAAMTGAAAAALVEMVCAVTLGDDGAGAVHDEMAATRDRLRSVRGELQALADDDAAAFDAVLEAYRRPAGEGRSAAIQEAMKGAADVPMETAERCLSVVEAAVTVTREGNQNAVTDAAAGAILGRAALEVALYNVDINLGSIDDEDYRATAAERAAALRADAAVGVDAVEEHLEGAL